MIQGYVEYFKVFGNYHMKQRLHTIVYTVYSVGNRCQQHQCVECPQHTAVQAHQRWSNLNRGQKQKNLYAQNKYKLK